MSEVVEPMGLGKLFQALSKAQSKIKSPLKTRTANATATRTYKYADLSDIIDAIKGPLSDNGLAFTQLVKRLESEPVLVTTLGHVSGEFIDSYYPLPKAGTVTPQQMGSAMTYAKKYSLSAIVGVSAEDDDDGAAASENKPESKDLKSPGEFVLSFTKGWKGKQIKEMPKSELEGLLAWAKKTNAFPDFQAAATEYLSIQKDVAMPAFDKEEELPF